MESIAKAPDIWFPNIGISIDSIDNVAVSNLFGLGFDIYWYGILIASGVLTGLLIVQHEARRTGQDFNIYIDYLLWAIIFCVIGARLYYVIFKWDDFKDNLWSIFAIRKGGLAIYGAIIAGFIVSVVYTKLKKINFFQFLDTIVFGLIIGQVIGRWGNFINREAFGGYTESFFAMRYKVDQIKETSQEVLNNLIQFSVDNTGQIVKYVQVHPTFLYESMWNLSLFIVMNIYKKHKKFEGEMIAIYFLGYGVGRFFIEGLRTDQLTIAGMAVSQIFSVFLIGVSLLFIVYNRRRKGKI